MSYKGLIGRNVIKAFNLVKDLADDVTLQNETTGDFNFSTGEVPTSQRTNISTKMIVTKVETKASETGTTEKEVLLKTADVGDLNDWSFISHEGVNWKFGPLIYSDRFVTLVKIYR